MCLSATMPSPQALYAAHTDDGGTAWSIIATENQVEVRARRGEMQAVEIPESLESTAAQ